LADAGAGGGSYEGGVGAGPFGFGSQLVQSQQEAIAQFVSLRPTKVARAAAAIPVHTSHAAAAIEMLRRTRNLAS
jgi:hypothetical protein